MATWTASRREFLGTTLATGIYCLFSGRIAAAMGDFDYPEGMQKVKGRVQLNGEPALPGMLVKAGDVVTTGPDSEAIFIFQRSVCLLRADTRFVLTEEAADGEQKLVQVLKVAYGRMLAVFPRGKKKIVTTTAVIGIRGSGIYVEVEKEVSYVCVCYGTAELQARTDPDTVEKIWSTHHDAPRYIYRSGEGKRIRVATVKNHTDDELIRLERMVWRKPDFMRGGFMGEEGQNIKDGRGY
jgi:hypothetical protein